MLAQEKNEASLAGPRFKRIRRPLFFFLFSAVLMMAACAGRPTRPDGLQQPCHPTADTAVLAGNWEKALIDHQRVLIEDPSNCLALYHLGFIWGHLGEREQEIDFYEAAIVCGYDSDDRLYFNLGMAFADTGEFDKAVQSFERGTGINPANPDPHFGLGLIHQREGRAEMAEAAFQRALSADATHRYAHLMLVRLYLDQSRWKEAETHLDTVRRIDPDDEEAEELRALMQSRRALEYHR